MDGKIINIESNPDTNAFLIRCFKEVKDAIVIEKLNEKDKISYYDCCKMLVEYENMYKK